MKNITIQYPLWFLIFCIIAGISYAAFMYYRDQKFGEAPRWAKPIMAALRFSTVSTLAFLLLSPVIKKINEEIKNPIIVLAEDKSQSIAEVMSAQELTNLKSNMDALAAQLSAKYEVVRLNFGEEVVPSTFDTFSYQSSNLSQAVKYIHDSYVDQNIGAVILSSDGIYNEGKNPIYENVAFTSPFYTIALGDTTVKKDLVVSNILANKIAYLGDKSVVQIDISAKNASNNSTKVTLYVNEGGQRKLIEQKTININGINDYHSLEFTIDNNRAGIVKYTAVVSALNNEISTANNTKDFYVEVLDGKQKILIYADGPHPDVAAINTLITNNRNYEVKTYIAGQGEVKVADYDLVIFHNLPSTDHDIQQALDILNRRNTPRLFIAGATISQGKFNTSQNILKLEGNTNSNEDVQPDIQRDFSLFTLSDLLTKQLNRYPPLTAKFGQFSLKGTAKALMTQKIKKVSTKYPLLAFSDEGGLKTAVLAGEGIWKWRIFDYQELNNNEAVEELLSKTIQYLTVKEDKRKFRVNLAKNIHKESEDIIFDAQLYNNSYEMVNDPDVLMSIRDEDNKEYKFSFSKTNNFYTLNTGQFQEGNYAYKASVNHNGESLTAEGRFRVEKVQLEQYNLTANHAVLAGLSTKYNGQVYYPNQINQLGEAIMNNEAIKPTVFLSSSSQSIIHNKWIFWLLLSLLGMEWFMRRYFGSY